MVEPLIPEMTPARWEPKVGQVVENFGNLGRIVEIDPQRGLLLRAMPDQAFLPGHDRWHADPEKCRPAITS